MKSFAAGLDWVRRWAARWASPRAQGFGRSLPLFCLGAAAALGGPTGIETAPGFSVGQYPAHWPAGPSPDSVPGWAAPGRIRFARWDGGRIETVKAILSGWPGFVSPDPDRLETMTNWYRPETVRYLQEAGINLIWATFSNGFSIETEAAHQAQVRRYIETCHRAGIHVMAYESLTNFFWEDMSRHVPDSREWIKLGPDGKPTPYGGGDYSKLGRVTRYLADLRQPGWRNYLRRRIDLAIDAGADGVAFDNNSTDQLLDAYQELYRYGARRKKDFLLMGNFHNKTYVYDRLVNAITTEDAFEPGIYSEAHAGDLNLNQKRYYGGAGGLLPVEGGLLVNNVGLYRIQQALSAGWKPTMVENGPREVGQRESDPMSAERHQLALAECRMYGVSMEVFVEGAFAQGLETADPAALRIWQAIGTYNRFFADHEGLYTNTRTTARLALLLDDRSAGVPLLNGLAARQVLFDVLYEHDLTAAKLAPYSAVAVLTAATLRDSAISALTAFASGGGRIFTTGDSAKSDENGRPRPVPVFAHGEFWEKLPSIDTLAQTLIAAAPPAIGLEAPAGVIANVEAQTVAGQIQMVVHLLNYRPRSVQGIKVRMPGRFRHVRLLSPDPSHLPVHLLHATEEETAVEVPELGIYSMLVFESPEP